MLKQWNIIRKVNIKVQKEKRNLADPDQQSLQNNSNNKYKNNLEHLIPYLMTWSKMKILNNVSTGNYFAIYILSLY